MANKKIGRPKAGEELSLRRGWATVNGVGDFVTIKFGKGTFVVDNNTFTNSNTGDSRGYCSVTMTPTEVLDFIVALEKIYDDNKEKFEFGYRGDYE